MDPRGGLKTNVKLSISPACHPERSRETVVIRGQGLALPTHMPRTSPLSAGKEMVGGGFRGSGYSREGAHFAANIPMTIHAAPLFPSFLWKEVPRRGGGWPRETVLPHSGKPTPPRFARLPLPEERARMIVYENTLYSKTPRRFPIFMRRTTPVEPLEPIESIEPAPPLSQTIKGQHAPEPRTPNPASMLQ